MSDRELHLDDHRAIMGALDCSKQVSNVEMKLILLDERVKELKEDKEKAGKQLLWVVGVALSIIMTVAGSLINSSATIQVHEEKIKEIKNEIEQTVKAFNAHEH